MSRNWGTCEPKAFSFQCMTEFTTNKKIKKKKKGICKSCRVPGPKCPVWSGAPTRLRFQLLSLFRGLTQDRVGLSWAAVVPLSCKLHPSLHSRKGVELWNAVSHWSLVLGELGVRLPNAYKPQAAPRELGQVEGCELFRGEGGAAPCE